MIIVTMDKEVYLNEVFEKGKNLLSTIEEHISQEFEVEAEDEKQAEDIAIEKYSNEEFVLENGSLIAAVVRAGNDGPWVDIF